MRPAGVDWGRRRGFGLAPHLLDTISWGSGNPGRRWRQGRDGCVEHGEGGYQAHIGGNGWIGEHDADRAVGAGGDRRPHAETHPF